MAERPFRVLSLDGGGAKGFYTLGVLREIEAMIGCPIHEKFDLIFGTSTGAIIASLLSLGKGVEEILALYSEHVPTVMRKSWPWSKSAALSELSETIYGEASFEDVKTYIGIVATRWVEERPMIFKADAAQAHGRKSSFTPGFGVKIKDAVQASCSAYPMFRRKTVTTDKGEMIELIDGGFAANNPTLYAIAEATIALKVPPEQVRVVSLGVGTYPPTKRIWTKEYWFGKSPGVKLAQKSLEINSQSMEQLRDVLYKHVPTVRISDEFSQPEMATDMFEHDVKRLNLLLQQGRESFSAEEKKLKEYLL